MKKTAIRRALREYRTEKCGIKMAIYEVLNELGIYGVEFSSKDVCPKALVIWNGQSKTISVQFLRLNDNVMELKDWDDPKAGWLKASFGLADDNVNLMLDPEDVSMALLTEDLIWEERAYK